jgi:hypothetical protein
MKAWQTACIPEDRVFADYQNGLPIQLNVLVYPDWAKEFEDGNEIQVFHTATSPGNLNFRGTILRNHGVVESLPQGNPYAVRLTVQRK